MKRLETRCDISNHSSVFIRDKVVAEFSSIQARKDLNCLLELDSPDH